MLSDPDSPEHIPSADRRDRILESRDEYQRERFLGSGRRSVGRAATRRQAGDDLADDRRGDGPGREGEPVTQGVLPKNYGRADLDKRRLGELVDLIGSIGFTNVDHGADNMPGKV